MKPAPLIEPEEISLVKQYVLLPILLNFLENDKEMIQSLNLHMSLVYNVQFKNLEQDAMKEMKILARNLKIRGIKILSQEPYQEGLYTNYICRGYQHQMTLLWSFVKTQIIIKLSEYLKINLVDEE